MSNTPKPIHPRPAHIELRELSEIALRQFKGIDRAQALSLARLVRQAREDAQGFHRTYTVICSTCGITSEAFDLSLLAAREIIRNHLGHSTSVWTTDPQSTSTRTGSELNLPTGDNVVSITSRRGDQQTPPPFFENTPPDNSREGAPSRCRQESPSQPRGEDGRDERGHLPESGPNERG